MDAIVIRGARENNLHAIDLELPRGELIVFCGVSGSGKSSLAFDTLHAEGQRRYLEALAGQIRGAQGLRRPAVDLIQGLPPTIALDQRATGMSSRATVGSYSECNPVLRLLFARAGVQHDPASGEVIEPRTHDEIVAALMEGPGGERLVIESPISIGADSDLTSVLNEVRRAGFSRVRLNGTICRLEEVTALPAGSDLRVVVDRIKRDPAKRDRLHDAVRTAAQAGRGVVIGSLPDRELVFVDRPFSQRSQRELPPLEPNLLSFSSPAGWCATCRGSGSQEQSPCPTCKGARLREEALAVRYQGVGISEALAWSVAEMIDRLDAWPVTAVTDLPLTALRRRLDGLVQLGLGELTLDRSVGELSTGEKQRLRLARQVAAELSGVLYVLDEPTAGLGAQEAAAVVELLRTLRDRGNTVLVVEHQPLVLEAADRIVEFGPGPGRLGGKLVFQGTVEALLTGSTVTGQWLSGALTLPRTLARKPTGKVVAHKIPRVSQKVTLPLGALVAITGRSGCGKTSVLDGIVATIAAKLNRQDDPFGVRVTGASGISHVIRVSRGAVGRNARSNPATYTGMWDTMRELLAATQEARIRGLTPATFSLNVKGGRCEVCKGSGVRRIDLTVLPDVFLPCEVCGGKRFVSDVLTVRWKGHSAAELLMLTAREAHALLAGHPKLEAVLRTLADVGLGYLQLGQPGHTLSGGEAQRLKLARELARGARSGMADRLYALDDPTVGLHPSDVAVLLQALQKLVEGGATVWFATHDQRLAAAADCVVELP